MQPTKKKKKKVNKMWAVIVYEDMLSAMETDRGLLAKAVFADANEAKKFIQEWPPKDEQNPRLVECTITYDA